MSRNRLVIWLSLLGLLFVLPLFGCSQDIPRGEPINKLYDNHPGKLVDNINGMAGVTFYSPRDYPINVTHIGFFDAEEDGLQINHGVALYEGKDEPVQILLEQVPFGEGAMLEGGYRWVRLDEPVRLKKNEYYTVVAEVYQKVGDPWPDVIMAHGGGTAVPNWNKKVVRFEAGQTPCPILSKKKEWPDYPEDIRPQRANSVFGAVCLGFEAVP